MVMSSGSGLEHLRWQIRRVEGRPEPSRMLERDRETDSRQTIVEAHTWRTHTAQSQMRHLNTRWFCQEMRGLL